MQPSSEVSHVSLPYFIRKIEYMTLLRGGSLHPEPKTEETCVISREEAEIPQKPNPVYCLLLHYIVVGKYSWEAEVFSKLHL